MQVRSERRARVEVECAVHMCVLPGAVLVHEGENEVEVYESDLPKIMDLVHDGEGDDDERVTNPSRIQAAEQWLERSKAEFMKRINEGRSEKERVEWARVAHEFDGPRTVPGAYVRLNPGEATILPLRRVKVLERGIPPKLSEGELRSQLVVEAIAKALAENRKLDDEEMSSAPRRRRASSAE